MIVSTRAAASLELKHEQRAQARTWQARAREFGIDVIHPLGQILDRMDPQAAVAAGSPLHDLLAQAQREGYTRLTDSPQRGGVGLSSSAEYLVLEELATADAGLAVLLIAAPSPFRWASAVSFGRLARSLSLPYFRLERLDWVGCYATVEQGTLRATPAVGGWLLTGTTDPVPGAAIATHAALACSTRSVGADGQAVAIVPLDRAGVCRGPASVQFGLRAQARAPLALAGVRLSSDELVLPPRTGAGPVRAVSALDHIANAIAAVGLARAAYEGALRSVRESAGHRDGLTEREHAQGRLFRLFTLLEAARATTRAAHRRAESGSRLGDLQSLHRAAAAHSFAAEAAFAIAEGARDLCRGRADACGDVEYLDGSIFRPEKLLRDARYHQFGRPVGASIALLAAENR
jgi:alkylation response protein AidB-like acyl-CoA dehydrogenase